MDFGQMMADAIAKQATTNPADEVGQSLAMQKSVVASLGLQNQAAGQQTDVRVQAADKAELLSKEAAALRAGTTNDVLKMFEVTQQQTASGIQAATQHLVAATEKTQKAAELDATRPSIFTNPLKAISNAYQSATLEDEVAAHHKTASGLATDVNALLQMSRVQIEETIATSSLRNSSILEQRTVELSAGIAQDTIRADAAVAEAGRFGKASADLYTVSKDAVGWALNRAQIATQKKSNKIAERRLEMDEAQFARDSLEYKLMQENIDNVATAIAIARLGGNGQPTQAEIIAAKSTASALAKANPMEFARMSSYGQTFKSSSDRDKAWATIMKNGTVGGLQLYGAFANNSEMQNFGKEMFQSQYAKNLEQGYREMYEASGSAKTYDLWLKGLKPAEITQAQKIAYDTASAAVADMPVADYVTSKSANRFVRTGGINLVSVGNAQAVQADYGYPIGTRENAALSSPQLKSILQESQQLGGDTKGTEKGLVALVDYLTKAKVADPYKVAAKLYAGQQGGAMNTEDSEYNLVLRGGYKPPIKAYLKSGGAAYDLASSEGVKRLYLLQKNPPTPAILAPITAVGDFREFLGKGIAYWASKQSENPFTVTEGSPPNFNAQELSAALNAGKAKTKAATTAPVSVQTANERDADRKASFQARMDYVGKTTVRNPMPAFHAQQPEFDVGALIDLELPNIQPTLPNAVEGASGSSASGSNASTTVQDPQLKALQEFNSGQQWWQK